MSSQSLGDLAGGDECTATGTEGISAQLTRYHECEFDSALTRLSNHPSVELASNRTYDLVANETRAAIAAAAEQTPLRISVAYRPVSEQFVMYKTSACATFEEPGADVHQSGTAIDVQNWEEAAAALVSAGCQQPSTDTLPLHFECPGPDMRENAVLIFQKLWNLNRPGDQITVDGIYGPQTESRLAMTPADGFSNPGCDAPKAETDASVASDAGETTDAGIFGRPGPGDGGCSFAKAPPMPYLLMLALLVTFTARKRAA